MKPVSNRLLRSLLLALSVLTWAGKATAGTPYSTLVLEDQPFLYWNFDEPSDQALQQVIPPPARFQANDLVPVGAERISHASLGSGLRLGNAATFSAGTYFIASGLKTGTNLIQGPWMIEFWMQVQGANDGRRNDYLLNFGPGGGNRPAVLYDYVGSPTPDNGLELFAGPRTDVGPEVSDEGWHHVVFVYYGNGSVGVADRVDIFVDGINSAQGVRGGFGSGLTVDSQMVVGTSAPQFAAGDGFEGRIDELAIYDLAALTTEEEVTEKAINVAGHFTQASADGVYAEAVKADEPFLYWTFDEEAGPALEQTGRGTVDEGPGTDNDLVPTGNVTRVGHDQISSGLRLGNALELDGASYMRAADLNIPTNSLPAPYAIEFWVQVLGENEGVLRNEYVLSMGGSGGNEPALIYDYVGNGGADQFELFQCCGASSGRSFPGVAVSDDGWHHVVVVFYGTDSSGVADRLEMYLDGVSDHQSYRNTYRRDLNLSGQFIVGSSPVLADAFTGRLDEVAVYDLGSFGNEAAVEAAASRIAADHFAAASAPTADYGQIVRADQPLLYWNFDEPEGNAIQQVVPTPDRIVDNDLTPTGAQRASHSQILSGLDLGNAAELSGANYFMAADLNTAKSLLTAPWMIEFWVQVQGANTDLRNDYLINFGGGGGNRPAVLYDYVGGANPQNGLELFAGPRSGAGPLIDDLSWHHVVFAFYGDGTSGLADRLDIFLDGVRQSGNIRGAFSSALALDARLVVGNSAPQFAAGDGFQGRLDELAIYDLSSHKSEQSMAARVETLVKRHLAGALLPINQPSLAIQEVPNAIQVSWPLAAKGFQLESTQVLAPANWQQVNVSPQVKGFSQSVSLPKGASTQFFRLRR